MKPGHALSASRTLKQEDFDRFAELSGDDNPIHVDAAYAARTPFRVPVAHGMLLYGLVHAELCASLPVARHLEQELMFPAATPVGATVVPRIEVRAADHGAVRIATTVTRDDGATVLSGEAVLSESDAAPRPPDGSPPAAERPGGAWEGTWWAAAPGTRAVTTQAFSAADVAGHADLVGAATVPGSVPEPLLAGIFSRILGTELPGRGTNYLKQRLTYHRPAAVGEALTATVRVVRVRPDKRLVDLETRCSGSGGRLVCAGRALVLARGVGTGDDS